MTPWTVASQTPSVHGISQARILEWVAISFSRGSSQPRDRTHVSCTAGRFFTTEPPGNVHCSLCSLYSMSHFTGGVTASRVPGTAWASGWCRFAQIRRGLWEGAGRFRSGPRPVNHGWEQWDACSGGGLQVCSGSQRNVQLRPGIMGPFLAASQIVDISGCVCVLRRQCLNSIANSVDMNLRKLQEMVDDWGWCGTFLGVAKSGTRLSNWTTAASFHIHCNNWKGAFCMGGAQKPSMNLMDKINKRISMWWRTSSLKFSVKYAIWGSMFGKYGKGPGVFVL